MNIRRTAAALTSAAALSVSGVAMATPASAAPVVLTGGLVNVTIVDAVDVGDVTVQVPVAAAANLCDIDVNILAIDAADGSAECTATANSRARR